MVIEGSKRDAGEEILLGDVEMKTTDIVYIQVINHPLFKYSYLSP